jgi:hypothetical protein
MATEGPWRNNHFTKDEEGPASNSVVSGLLVVVKSWGFELELLSPKQHKANADFIAAAREALPALLAENERLRASEIDAAVTIGELNSSAPLQDLMKINNEILSRAIAAEKEQGA